MRIDTKLPDFRRVIVDLDKVAKDKLKLVSLELKSTADDAVMLAKSAAPVNESLLRNSISRKDESEFSRVISANTKYAAFMEFGTKTLVSIPPGAEEIAAEARKIKGGTIEEMERSIRRWVKLKGLAGTYSVKTRRRTGGRAVQKRQDDQLVFLIMRKILKIGVKPQPFFYPAITQATKGLAMRLTKIVTQ